MYVLYWHKRSLADPQTNIIHSAHRIGLFNLNVTPNRGTNPDYRDLSTHIVSPISKIKRF